MGYVNENIFYDIKNYIFPKVHLIFYVIYEQKYDKFLKLYYIYINYF